MYSIDLPTKKFPITHSMLLTLWHTDTYPLISQDNHYGITLE